MIRSVRETYEGKTPHGDGLEFWTYMICRVYSDRRGRYDLIRIDNAVEKMEVLGRELSYSHCRRLIATYEGIQDF